jgi:predicted GNAT family acetyltransferase
MSHPAIAPLPVVHDPDRARFEAVVDGLRCEASYEMIGGVMWLVHTGVPRALRDRGIAAQLVQAALDHARVQGLKVHPACSYVRAYMRRHPETRDLHA